MAHFLYFVEDMHAFSQSGLEAAGLSYAIGDGCTRSECRTGPSNVGGMVLTKSGRCGYYPEQQTWRRMRDKVWVGITNDSPPTEEETRRPKLLASFPVEMASGQSWQVPLAFEWYERDDRYAYEPSLPAYSELDDAGRWTRGAVRPEYARLWEIASFAWDVYFGGESPDGKELAASDARAMAAEVLAVNYRVGPWECSLLRLFDDPPRVAIDVLKACCGWPIVAEWLKKKAVNERSASGEISGKDGVAA